MNTFRVLLPLILAVCVLCNVAAGYYCSTCNLVRASTYDMRNGGQGSYFYHDDTYSNGGCSESPACNYIPLSGGTGQLQDGVKATGNWNVDEAPAGPGPYVGWQSTSLNPVEIVFHFDKPRLLDRILIFADDSDNTGGVDNPSKVELYIQGGGALTVTSVPDPAGTAPFVITISDQVFVQHLRMVLSYNFLLLGSPWIFISEIEFYECGSAQLTNTPLNDGTWVEAGINTGTWTQPTIYSYLQSTNNDCIYLKTADSLYQGYGTFYLEFRTPDTDDDMFGFAIDYTSPSRGHYLFQFDNMDQTPGGVHPRGPGMALFYVPPNLGCGSPSWIALQRGFVHGSTPYVRSQWYAAVVEFTASGISMWTEDPRGSGNWALEFHVVLTNFPTSPGSGSFAFYTYSQQGEFTNLRKAFTDVVSCNSFDANVVLPYNIPSTCGVSAATINWADGSAVQAMTQDVAQSVLRATHRYTTPGVYRTQVSITGTSGTEVTEVVVMVGNALASTGLTKRVLPGNCPFDVSYCNNNGGFTLAAPVGGSPGYSYAWTLNSSPFSPANPLSLSSLVSGAYSVTITDTRGCSISKSSTLTRATMPSYTPQWACNSQITGFSSNNFCANPLFNYNVAFPFSLGTSDSTITISDVTDPSFPCSVSRKFRSSEAIVNQGMDLRGWGPQVDFNTVSDGSYSRWQFGVNYGTTVDARPSYISQVFDATSASFFPSTNVFKVSDIPHASFKVTVRTNNDDDFFGFALGYENAGTNTDFLLFDWKRLDQFARLKGLQVARFPLGRDPNTLTFNDWWDKPLAMWTYQVGARTLSNTGYIGLQTYTFEYDWSPERVQVWVDGVQQFDLLASLSNPFSDGAFAFYVDSQEQVQFGEFTPLHTQATGVCQTSNPIGIKIPFIDDKTCNSNTLTAIINWDDGSSTQTQAPPQTVSSFTPGRGGWLTLSHPYTDTNVHNVVVTLRGASGAQTSVTVKVMADYINGFVVEPLDGASHNMYVPWLFKWDVSPSAPDSTLSISIRNALSGVLVHQVATNIPIQAGQYLWKEGPHKMLPGQYTLHITGEQNGCLFEPPEFEVKVR